jgi:hypothetical protein
MHRTVLPFGLTQPKEQPCLLQQLSRFCLLPFSRKILGDVRPWTHHVHISSNFILSISLLIMFDTLLLRPSLHCNTPLHCTTLHDTSPNYTSPHFTTLIDTSLPLIYTSLPTHLALRIYISYCSVSPHITKLPSERGDNSAVGRGWAGRPDHDQQHCYHHAPKVKSEAATAVELLMMGMRTPETCWAVNKCQVKKLEKLLHLVGDLFELYDDARTYKL